MKKMNKLVSLLLALAMCASLAACGGPNKQPTVDAFNKAKDAFNEVSAIMNEDPEAYGDFFDDMVGYAETLNEISSMLNNNELSQEELDNLTDWCKEVEQWANDVKSIL